MVHSSTWSAQGTCPEQREGLAACRVPDLHALNEVNQGDGREESKCETSSIQADIHVKTSQREKDTWI